MNNLSAVEPIAISPPSPTLIAEGDGAHQMSWTHPRYLSQSGAPHQLAGRPHKTAQDHADDCRRLLGGLVP